LGTHNPVEAAFEDAWKPYKREYGSIYASALKCYERAISNTLFDDDTNSLLRYAMEEARRKENVRP